MTSEFFSEIESYQPFADLFFFSSFVQTSKQQPNNGSFGQGFEQDEGPSSSSANNGYNLAPVTALETGFVSNDVDIGGNVDPSQPIFQLGRVQYAFSAPLALLTVSSNILTMCMYDYPSPVRLAQGAPMPPLPRIVRINLDDPEKTVEAEIPLAPLPRARNAPAPDPSLMGPHKMFSDPTGKHLIITTRNGENFYWISGWKKAKALPKLKGLVIESVAWNQSASSSTFPSNKSSNKVHKRAGSGASTPTTITTKEILIGTQTGDLYETMLTTNSASDGDEGDFLDRFARRTANTVGGSNDVDKYLHHVFRLSERQPVTGLVSEIFGPSTQISRAVVIATTSTRIYEFVGELKSRAEGDTSSDSEALYNKLFLPYRTDAIPNLKSELPGDLPYSELHLWTPKGKRNAKALAWLTGPGIYHGLISYGDQQVGDSVIDSANLLPYPAMALYSPDGENEGEMVAEIPLSAALTEFHFVLLYRDRVMAISSLDDHVVFQESLPLQPNERVIGTAVDTTRGSYWLYTDSSIFELVITEEDRHVWRIYLERNNHEQALKYAKSTLQREQVLSSQGDLFFRDGKFIQAAQCYAQTFSRTFEEIVLQFLDCNERDALRYFLVMRLERLRRSDLTQRMMLATWLVEIYLGKINDLEDVAAAEEASQNVDNYRIEMDLLQDELKQFLVTYKDNLDRRTIFGLITKHGRAEFLLHFAAITGEHDRIVQYWIREEDWEKALSAITGQHSLELYYRFATTLIRHLPRQTIDSWTKQERLSPRKLIPAMALYKSIKGEPNYVIQYLQAIVRNGATDSSLHNFLLSLLAKHDDPGLIPFLTSSVNNPLTGQPYYDLDFALRTCSSFGKTEACVRIFAKMSNFENAVDLAIQAGNVDLACTCADAIQFQTGNHSHGQNAINGIGNQMDTLEGRQSLRKQLWLKVARFVVEEKNDLAAAMAFLARAPDLLSIEDILPFFPDFTVIDTFKDDICNALENYAQKIDTLKSEMDAATQSAESIRADTQKLANRFVSVEANEKCGVCQELVLQRQFYVFACNHAFHADCLVSETTKYLSPRTLRRILILQEELSSLTGGLIPSLPPSYAAAVASSMNSTANAAFAAAQKAATGGMGTVTNGVNLLGLDKLRELILPDAIVGAISASVSVGVASGRKALAPLDPFADPTASLRAKPAGLDDVLNGKVDIEQEEDGNIIRSGQKTQMNIARRGRKLEEEQRIAELREELDGLVASACILCDGSVQAINRPFVTDANELEEWEL